MGTEDDVAFLRTARTAVAETMHGLEHVTDLVLTALISEGHVLLEGNPGLGKTALVRTLTAALGLSDGRMGRIQFTPDLMPADITGTEVPDPDNPNRLTFRDGPVFCWLLLADEINRATPKTQAAMLEAMAERQVTVLGDTKPIRRPETVSGGAVLPPFMVLATQNPIEQQGTFDLPEAQLDRFMFKVTMPFPDQMALARILDKETRPDGAAPPGGGDPAEGLAWARLAKRADPRAETEPAGLLHLHRLRGAVRTLDVLPLVTTHAINMIQASNGHFDADRVRDVRDRAALRTLVEDFMEYPLGPRAGTALLMGAKAMTLVALSDPARPSPPKDLTAEGLARVALASLRHRIKLVRRWQDSYRKRYDPPDDTGSDADLLDDLIGRFARLAAPVGESYRDAFEAGLPAGLGRPRR